MKNLVIHKTGQHCWVTEKDKEEVLFAMDGHDIDVIQWAIDYLGTQGGNITNEAGLDLRT